MLLTLISTYMQNIIWILLVHNLFLAANVYKYTVRYAVRLPKSWLHDALDYGSISCTRVGYRMHWIMVQFHVQELVTGCTGLWFNFMYKSWLQDELDYG